MTNKEYVSKKERLDIDYIVESRCPHEFGYLNSLQTMGTCNENEESDKCFKCWNMDIPKSIPVNTTPLFANSRGELLNLIQDYDLYISELKPGKSPLTVSDFYLLEYVRLNFERSC